MSSYVILNLLAALYLTVMAFFTFKRLGGSFTEFIKLAIAVIFAFFIGSRILYGVLYYEKIAQNSYKLIAFELKNFALFGGLIFSVAVLWLFIKWNNSRHGKRFEFLQLTDSMMPHLGIALILSKFGCFFNGCCYGFPTHMPWGVEFERADQSVISQMLGNSWITGLLNNNVVVYRHPTQIYEAIFALFAIVVSIYFLRRQKRPGIATASFILIFTIGRWISFVFRDFPNASDLSNFIRGPVIYGSVILVVLTWLVLVRKKTG